MTQSQSIVAEAMSWTARRRLPPLVPLAALSLIAMMTYADVLLRLGVPLVSVTTVVVVGLAALAASIAGFGFSATCGAMLFQFRHDTVGVVEIMLICSIANQAFGIWLLRRSIRLPSLAPFMIGGLMGVPVGAWLLLHLDAAAFVAALGILLVAHGGYMLLRRPVTLPSTTRASDVVSGFLGGLAGGFAASPGAPVSIWCGMKGWDKARQRAVFQPFILVMQFAALGAIALMHAKGAPVMAVPPIAWACVPAGLLGTWWGVALFKRLTDNQFAKAVNVLLIVSGIGLIA